MMGYRVRCNECRGYMPFEGTMPTICPLCGVGVKTGDDDVISVPAFLTKSKHVDRVYRDMEKGSEIHAEKAAEMAGVPVSEMSTLKITNMRDNARAGDIAAMPVNNEVTQKMDQIRAAGGQIGFQSDASAYGSQVQSGPHPNAGARFLTQMAAVHGKIVDLPANETRQPGYRRRG